MRKWYGLVVALAIAVLSAGCADPSTLSAQPSAGPRPESAWPRPASAWPTAGVVPSRGPVPGPSSVPSSPGAVTPPGSPVPPLDGDGSASAWPNAGVPSNPPRDPTDNIKTTETVVGIVTRGGSGPCFGVQTDDGTEYALYSFRQLTLTRGQYVRVDTEASDLRIDCGPGRFRTVTEIEPLS